MWESRPNHLQLLPQEIQLWKANLDITDDLVSEFWATLSDSEKSRANRFRFPQHRRHFIAGRGILRHLLSQYLQLPAMDFLINYGPQGKPFLPDFPDFSFNISHSKNHALLAFAQKMTIGVDVECLDPTIEFEVIAPNFFSKNEATTLLSLPKAEQPLAFYNCWTRKEAFIKAKGGGLSIPLDEFEVTLLPNDPPKILTINWAMEEVSKWFVYAVCPENEVVGALVSDKKPEKIGHYVWSSVVI